MTKKDFLSTGNTCGKVIKDYVTPNCQILSIESQLMTELITVSAGEDNEDVGQAPHDPWYNGSNNG